MKKRDDAALLRVSEILKVLLDQYLFFFISFERALSSQCKEREGARSEAGITRYPAGRV